MLRQLRFSNFKAWDEAKLEFGEVTCLFGTNSSGKTSFLQFLLMLKQTKEAADRGLSLELGGPYVNLGSYSDFISNHDTSKALLWQLVWSPEKPIELIDASAKRTEVFARSHHLGITSAIVSARGAPLAIQLIYRIAEQMFSLQFKREDRNRFQLTSKLFKLRRTKGRAWQLPGPVKSYGFPDQVLTYYQNTDFLAELVASFESQMDKVFHLGPLRDNPRREYTWNRSRPSGVGQRGEKTIEAILSATDRRQFRNHKPRSKLQPFQAIIAYWLKEMGLVSSFAVKELKEGSGIYQALVRVRPGAPEVLLTEVGFGVSQVLPVLTLLYYADEGATVLLEQPEIHLHPLAQTALADVILTVALHRKIQVVVESHSEHFLLRLQRRVAEGLATPDNVKLYFCKTDTGKSQLVPLELDMFGAIKNWPDDFFGDAFEETAEAQKARLKRRISQS